MPRLLLYSLLFTTLLFASCASSDQTSDGSGMLLVGVELAEFDFKPTFKTENEETAVYVSFSSIHNAMRYIRQDDNYYAEGELLFDISRENDPNSTQQIRKTYSNTVSSSSVARGYGRYYKSFRLISDPEPGTYRIRVTHTDTGANESYNQESSFRILSEETAEAAFTSPVISYDEEEGRQTASSNEITGSSSQISVEFMAAIPEQGNYVVESRLSEIRSDNRPAQYLGIPLQDRSIVERGVNRANQTQIAEQSEQFNSPGLHHVRHNFERPPTGPVMLRVRIKDDQGEVVASHEEELLFRSPNFPSIESVRELAAPLYYLMDDNEYREMMALEDETEMRNKWDEFWLRHYGSASEARTAITTYYTNVELANIYFSNFKEGWKTDMGKVFILFGQPMEIDRSPNRFRWYYSLDRRDPRYRFLFERPGAFDRAKPYDHYVLSRSRIYEEVEYQRVRDWLTGNIAFRR